MPLRISKTILSEPNTMRSLYCAVLDADAGYAYFAPAAGTNVNPGRIIKVDVRGATPVEVSSLTVSPGDFSLNSAMIDPSAGYAYFCPIAASPGRVLKIALESGTNAPQLLGALTLSNGENGVQGCLADTANGYGYLCCGGGTSIIVKIALGTGTNLPTRIGALGMLESERALKRGVIDTNNGYAYFAPIATAGLAVVKIALGAGTNLPSRIGSAPLPSEERPIGGFVLDSINGYLYGGIYAPGTNTSRIVKISCGAGTNPPVRIGSISMLTGERELSTGVCDPAGGYALFGCDHMHPARVFKIAMTPGTNLPVRLGYIPLNTGTDSYPVADGGNISSADAVRYGELYLQSSVIDPARGLAWFGTDTKPGQVVKVAGAADVLAYDDWRMTRFSSNDLGNAAVSGPSADPDADSQPNLLEYVLRDEPLMNDAAPTFAPSDSGFMYSRRLHLFDTACQVEIATDLLYGAWTHDPGTIVEQPLATNGEMLTVVADFADPTNATGFMRLQVVHP